MSRITNKGGYRPQSHKHMPIEHDALHHCLLENMAADPDLVVLASAMATNVLPTADNLLTLLVREVAAKYPARLFGLGEFLQDLVPTATRLINKGLKPLALMGAEDLARSYAGLSAACASNLPMTFILISGQDLGRTWRPKGVNDLSVLLTLPTLAIVEPADSAELCQLLGVALNHEEGPVCMRYFPLEINKQVVKPSLGPVLGVGKGQMLRQGKEVALVAFGVSVGTALKVAEELHLQGHEAAIVEARWARPLDEPLLGAVANHFRRIITLENGTLNGGFGAALLELFESKEWRNVSVHRLDLSGLKANETDGLSQEVSRFVDKVNQAEVIKLPFGANQNLK